MLLCDTEHDLFVIAEFVMLLCDTERDLFVIAEFVMLLCDTERDLFVIAEFVMLLCDTEHDLFVIAEFVILKCIIIIIIALTIEWKMTNNVYCSSRPEWLLYDNEHDLLAIAKFKHVFHVHVKENLTTSSNSFRMCVMNHNWSATK